MINMSNKTPIFSDDLVYLWVGKCEDLLPHISSSINLFIADPPYNNKTPYKGYHDNLPFDEFFQWCQKWITLAAKKLAPNGSIFLIVPDKISYPVHNLAIEAGLVFEQTIIWSYRFGQHRKNGGCIPCHCPILWFSRGQPKFNAEAILIESDRRSKYNDKRIKLSERIGLRVPGTVWGDPGDAADWAGDGSFWGRVQGNNRERRSLHPNQIPERIIDRLILGWSDVGDLVVDPFCGSGTTATIARARGRQCITIEQSEIYAQSAWERITKIGPKSILLGNEHAQV